MAIRTSKAHADRASRLKANNLAWRRRHPEQYRQMRQAWSVKNREKRRADQRAWYAKHRDQERERQRNQRRQHLKERRALEKAWRDANKQKVAEKSRRWNIANRGRRKARVRARYAIDPIPFRAFAHQRRARERKAPGFASAQQIADRVAFYGWRCAYCGGSFEHLDHVIPLSRGGSNWPANIRPACARCNRTKNNKTLAEWSSRS